MVKRRVALLQINTPVLQQAKGITRRLQSLERASLPIQTQVIVQNINRRSKPNPLSVGIPNPTQSKSKTIPVRVVGLYAIDFDFQWWSHTGKQGDPWMPRTPPVPEDSTKPIKSLNGSYFMYPSGVILGKYTGAPVVADRYPAPDGSGIFIADVVGLPESAAAQVVATQVMADVNVYLLQVVDDEPTYTFLHTITNAEGLGIVHLQTGGDNIVGVTFIRDSQLCYAFSQDAAPAIGVTWDDSQVIDLTGTVAAKQGYKLWYDAGAGRVFTAYTVEVPPPGPGVSLNQSGTLDLSMGSVNFTFPGSTDQPGVLVAHFIVREDETITSITDPEHTWTLLGDELVAQGHLYLYSTTVDPDIDTIDPVEVTITGTGTHCRLDAWNFYNCAGIDSFDLFAGASPLAGNQSGGSGSDTSTSLWDNAQWNQSTGILILDINGSTGFPGEVVGGWFTPVNDPGGPLLSSWDWEWTNSTEEIVIPVLMLSALAGGGERHTRVASSEGVDPGEDGWTLTHLDDLALVETPTTGPLKDFVHSGDTFLGYIQGLEQPFFRSTNNGASWEAFGSPEVITEDIAGLQIGTATQSGYFVLFSNGNTYYVNPETLEFTLLATLEPDISVDTPLLFGIV